VYIYKCKPVRVVDGDTVILDIDLGFHITVRKSARLLGYDAPETFGVKKTEEEYKKGTKATEHLRSLLTKTEYTCRTQLDKNDKYGRVLVDIYSNEDSIESINEQMIEFVEKLRKEDV
jgi:micrococcal nuclease